MHSAVKAEFSLRTLCEDRGLLHRGLCVRTEDFLHRVAQRAFCGDRGLFVQRALCEDRGPFASSELLRMYMDLRHTNPILID